MRLEVKDLAVRYGAHTVLDHVNLTLETGQWLMLCGPNGAGKSTLVKAIAQSAPYTGGVFIDGRDAGRMKPAHLAREVGVLSQYNEVGYAFTVEEVVSLGRYAHARGLLGGGDPQGAQKIEAALSATGMTALRRQSMLTLSGGEMQRAFLSQVLAQEPRLLLLDEPSNHLDLAYQKQLFALIGTWLKTPGRAAISVVHDLNLALRYGTHALLLDHGRRVASGETRRVLTRENLQKVYGMDVYGWMREMLGQWKDERDAKE